MSTCTDRRLRICDDSFHSTKSSSNGTQRHTHLQAKSQTSKQRTVTITTHTLSLPIRFSHYYVLSSRHAMIPAQL